MKGRITDKEVIEELKNIASKNKGVLLPIEIVNAARKTTSPLHDYFTWEDSEAAEYWRLHEARQILRIAVQTITVDGKEREARVFVSLTTDRAEEGGGYRSIVSVLSDKEYRLQLLQDAMDEINIFREKYKDLKELSVIFEAIDKVKNK